MTPTPPSCPPYIRDDKPGVIIATDSDPAGWKAAQRAYWHLAIRGDDRSYVTMPEGADPAQILRDGGPAALQHLIIDRQPLARILIEQSIRNVTDEATMVRDCSDVIVALRPERWPALFSFAQQRISTGADVLQAVASRASADWSADLRREARRGDQSDFRQHVAADGRTRPEHADESYPAARQSAPLVTLKNQLDLDHTHGNRSGFVVPPCQSSTVLIGCTADNE